MSLPRPPPPQNIPCDIIYHVYFFVNDYSTINNFWLLCKTFTNTYMTQYSKAYSHKFYILYKDLFTFLNYLPRRDLNQSDIKFYEFVTTQCLDTNSKILLRKDIIFIYKLITSTHKIKRKIVFKNDILLGTSILTNKIFKIKFNKNKVQFGYSYS